MLLKVDIFVPVCTAGFVYQVKAVPVPRMWGWFCVRFAPPLELIRGFCPTCVKGGSGVVWCQMALEDPRSQGGLVHMYSGRKARETVWRPLRTVDSKCQCPLMYVPRPLVTIHSRHRLSPKCVAGDGCCDVWRRTSAARGSLDRNDMAGARGPSNGNKCMSFQGAQRGAHKDMFPLM